MGKLCCKVSASPSSPFVTSSTTEDIPNEDTPDLAPNNNQGHETCEGALAEQRDSIERHQLTSDFTCEIKTVDDQPETPQTFGRYEYMDIGPSDSSEGGDPECERRGSETSATSVAEKEETDQVIGALKNEHMEEEEVEKRYNTNKQATHRGDLNTAVTHRPDVLAAGGGKVEEYEEMTASGEVPAGWDNTEYENLPVKGRAAPEEVGGGRCAGIGEYIKVCAGVGESGTNTSFDNPDYWHSRLFLKTDAVRT